MRPLLLVVEDELFLRLDLMELAQHEGFDTLEAGNAHEALEILEQRSDVKVVFTDIRMPGDLDGLALAHIIRKRWPLTVVVICSGNEPPTEAAMPSGATFMPKPCTGPKVHLLMSDIRSTLAH